MQAFLILCEVDPIRLELFGRLRAEHYAFLLQEQHRIVFGGPARSAIDGPPETMLIVVTAPALDDAETFITREPYNAHGGFRKVTVRPWSQVLPETETGALARTLATEHRTQAGHHG